MSGTDGTSATVAMSVIARYVVWQHTCLTCFLPGHREEVGEPRGPEVRLDLGGEPGRVADRQAGQQPARRGRQHARGLSQPGPQPARRLLPPRRRRDLPRRAADPQHRDREVAPACRGEQPVGGGGLAGEQRGPPVGGCDQQHPPAHRPAGCADLGALQHRRHEHLARVAGPGPVTRAPQRPRVVGDDDPQPGRGTSLGGAAQRVLHDEQRVGGDNERCRGRAAAGRDDHARSGGAPVPRRRDPDEQHAPEQHDHARDRPERDAQQHDGPDGERRRYEPQVGWAAHRVEVGGPKADGERHVPDAMSDRAWGAWLARTCGWPDREVDNSPPPHTDPPRPSVRPTTLDTGGRRPPTPTVSLCRGSYPARLRPPEDRRPRTGSGTGRRCPRPS
ncbi:hypothetical protein GCM10023320_23600 [Pseudonocardia adelaidensis]|uniref:Uncharacterized protein n=1 Tax=Pseudonocardia adelaidensis TaxID=648754 RepID=A0ABP9NGN3_9PSEU